MKFRSRWPWWLLPTQLVQHQRAVGDLLSKEFIHHGKSYNEPIRKVINSMWFPLPKILCKCSSHRFHSTMKKQFQHRQLRFPQLLQNLIDISLLREEDRNRKAIKASLRFPTGKLPPFVEKINQEYTPFAAKLIAEQYSVNTSAFSSIFVRFKEIPFDHLD